MIYDVAQWQWSNKAHKKAAEITIDRTAYGAMRFGAGVRPAVYTTHPITAISHYFQLKVVELKEPLHFGIFF